MTEESYLNRLWKDLDDLCLLHDLAMFNYVKCREFSSRLSVLLLGLEEIECYKMADRVMDVLSSCSPKEASHCEKALLVKGMMERMRDRASLKFLSLEDSQTRI